MTVDNDAILKRLKKDREGLIKQGNELREGIAELQRRLHMVSGALQYVEKLLTEEESNAA